jgi:hypothetical protein
MKQFVTSALITLLFSSCFLTLPGKGGLNKTKWTDAGEVKTGKWVEQFDDPDSSRQIIISRYKNGEKKGRALILFYEHKDSSLAWYYTPHYKHGKQNGWEKDYYFNGQKWMYVRRILYRNDTIVRSKDFVLF